MATKKQSKATKRYLNDAGEESAHAKEGYSTLRFQFNGGGKHDIKLDDIHPSLHGILAMHGLSQKLGDTYAGDESVADAEESFTTMLERLKAGDWVSDRTGLGPSPVLILEAIAAAKAEAGLPHDAEAAKEKYKTKEAREAALAVPAVKKHYERLRAERAAAKAAEAAKAAGEGAGDVASL